MERLLTLGKTLPSIFSMFHFVALHSTQKHFHLLHDIVGEDIVLPFLCSVHLIKSNPIIGILFRLVVRSATVEPEHQRLIRGYISLYISVNRTFWVPPAIGHHLRPTGWGAHEDPHPFLRPYGVGTPPGPVASLSRPDLRCSALVDHCDLCPATVSGGPRVHRSPGARRRGRRVVGGARLGFQSNGGTVTMF